MTLDTWLRDDPRRSFVSCYSRAHGQYAVFIRDPGGLPAQTEILGDTKSEAEENAKASLGLE